MYRDGIQKTEALGKATGALSLWTSASISAAVGAIATAFSVQWMEDQASFSFAPGVQ
jgi:hypothetical protein